MDELTFLRAEVSKLERFIEASAESRAATARQAQQLQRDAQLCHECLETALVEVGSSLGWEALRADSADLGQLGRAALLEMRGLAVDTAVLRAEMALVESERNAAREVEAYALSVARSYRGFASQGAARLDEVKGRLRGAHGRMQQQLDGVREVAPLAPNPTPTLTPTPNPDPTPTPDPNRNPVPNPNTHPTRTPTRTPTPTSNQAALLALRRRAVRSLVGLRCGLAARAALTRWQQAVAMERFTRGMAIQLQAAARQEEVELREQRWQGERRSRADRAHAALTLQP